MAGGVPAGEPSGVPGADVPGAGVVPEGVGAVVAASPGAGVVPAGAGAGAAAPPGAGAGASVPGVVDPGVEEGAGAEPPPAVLRGGLPPPNQPCVAPKTINKSSNSAQPIPIFRTLELIPVPPDFFFAGLLLGEGWILSSKGMETPPTKEDGMN
jgi:hypothetical protein